MDFTSLVNPYDFSNPVSDEDLFVGRDQEMQTIRYYLEDAKKSLHPTNIAILGPRASGKTSLLNMTEHQARKLGLFTVRLNLDEGDVATTLGFFFKLLDAILLTAFDYGAFGGRSERTYDTYLDMVYGFSAPMDKTFCPLIFPVLYAKAMASGNQSVPVPDTSIMRDLQTISEEVDKTFVVLFDECNVLSKQKILLEKLRNIFMNMSKFMLVFAGTPDLFPAMDDVFSPIVRQFLKISVGEFKSPEDTGKCMYTPLQKSGVFPSELVQGIFNHPKEMHSLTGGRPYEIQLICHIMFRRLQLGQARGMTLDIDCINELLSEIESSQQFDKQGIKKEIRKLNEQSLWTLSKFCCCSGKASLEDMWGLDFVVNNGKAYHKEKMIRQLELMEASRIVSVGSNGIIQFCGDQSDRLYARYFAHSLGIEEDFDDRGVELYWLGLLERRFRQTDGVQISNHVWFSDEDLNVIKMSQRMQATQVRIDVFEKEPTFLLELYGLMANYRMREHVPIIQIGVVFEALTNWTICYAPDPTSASSITESLADFESMKSRAREIGIEMLVSLKEVSIMPFEPLVRALEITTNKEFRRKCAIAHYNRLLDCIDKCDEEEAMFNAEIALRYCSDQDQDQDLKVGIAFMYMIANRIDEARQILDHVTDRLPELSTRNWAIYLSGLVKAKAGDFATAVSDFDRIINCLESNHIELSVPRALIPVRSDRTVLLEKRGSSILHEIAKEAKQQLCK